MILASDHKKFKSHLRRSDEARWYVARWLLHRGYPIRFDTLEISPTHHEREEHGDSGDLYVLQTGKIWRRIEVKERPTLDFTCRENFKHTAGPIVCTCDSYDCADPKPYCYIILNRTWTHGMFILGGTRDHWTREEIPDGRYEDYKEWDYIAPWDVVQFAPISAEGATNIFPHQGDRPATVMLFPVVKEVPHEDRPR